MNIDGEAQARQVGVLIVDDAEVIRTTVTRFLATETAIKVLGVATNFKEAVSLAATLKPDVILLDVHMRDYYTFTPESIKTQLAQHGSKILAMSLLSNEQEDNLNTRTLADSLGAVKLLDKAQFFDELIPAILGNRSDENDAVSVEFVYSESGRFYYRVTVVGSQHGDCVFNVWISGQQELEFGASEPIERNIIIGFCQATIKQWCIKFPNRLPHNGATTELNLNEIFFKP